MLISNQSMGLPELAASAGSIINKPTARPITHGNRFCLLTPIFGIIFNFPV